MTLLHDVQQDGQQNADSDAAGAVSGASASPAVPRPNRGRFQKGNTKAGTPGRYSEAVAKALLPEQRETLAILAAHEAGIFIDLGGEDELSTFERDLVRKYQQLDALAEYNAARMFASRATVRREARETFMNALDRQLKIVNLLGAKRRSRDITDLSITDYMQQRQADTSKTDATSEPRS